MSSSRSSVVWRATRPGAGSGTEKADGVVGSENVPVVRAGLGGGGGVCATIGGAGVRTGWDAARGGGVVGRDERGTGVPPAAIGGTGVPPASIGDVGARGGVVG